MADTFINPSAVPTTGPTVGSDLGSYRLLERLGAGGMGEVFSAEHRLLGKRVAVKLLQPCYAQDPEMVRRFFQEARAASRIEDENIVEVFDYAEPSSGWSYLVMELLVGGDLAQIRAGGPFGLARALRISRQIASAIAAAHEAGIVHRDLKPENVFLTVRQGVEDFVKVLDFGLAKLSLGIVSEPAWSRPGMIVGTPNYMSPEQAGGRLVDFRTDLYSLGLLLYWMLVDKIPHAGGSFSEILIRRETMPPPSLPRLTPMGESIPPELAQIVQRCLAHDPAARPGSARDLALALARLSPPAPHLLPAPHSPGGPTVSSGSAPPHLWFGPIALAALLALAVGALVWLRSKASTEILAPFAQPRAKLQEAAAPKPLPTRPDREVPVVRSAQKPKPLRRRSAAPAEPIHTDDILLPP